MKAFGPLCVLAAFCSVAGAGVRSGRVEADWISAASTYEPGNVVQMAIRLVIDPGWHSYWLNPGEAGMKTSVKWELPAGWVAGELENPAPKRFTGAGVVGFGYKGTVIFPVKFTAPIGFKGAARLTANVSWLTCDDQACVPGNAELTVSLNEGPLIATPEAQLIDQALRAVPQVRQAWGPLEVLEKEGTLLLTVTASGEPKPDLGACEVFPTTPGIIDPNHEIKFSRNGETWTAQVPKSRYVPTPVRELTLVVVPKSEPLPVLLHWKIR